MNSATATKNRFAPKRSSSNDLTDDSNSSGDNAAVAVMTGVGENDADYDSSGGYDDDSSSPPFLPLEEQNHKDGGGKGNDDNPLYTHLIPSSKRRRKPPRQGRNSRLVRSASRFIPKTCSTKTLVSFFMCFIISLVIWDALFTPPERRWIKPESSLQLLEWVQAHPAKGLIAILFVIAACVVVMVPLGTPLTLGCGYVYKGAYGWKLGVTIATAVSMGGSALGAVVCFLLGRYLMRDTVRKWIRKYPLFDAIDVASAEHGLRIMAMLYLTPILPLGPVSYMCGTTSMTLTSFILAKIAALPLMMLYVFIGASTGALIGKDAAAQVKEIEENEFLIVSGIGLSVVMIACITHYVKKELNTILERQQKLKPGEKEKEVDDSATEEAAIEMGMTRRRVA